MASRSEEAFWTEEDAQSLAETTDVELLKRAWRNEKAAPEILTFQANLVQRSREQIQLLTDHLCACLPACNHSMKLEIMKYLFLGHVWIYVNGVQEETVEELSGNASDDLIISLYQMDLDRTLFLLRSYLRVRLQKIEKYMLHISKTQLWNRLSEQEQKFAEKCTDIMEKHLQQSVLARLPYGYQSILKQSISSEEDDMVPEPQLDTFIFCKSKGSVGAFQLDDTGDEIVDLVADDLYVLRYKSIKGLVEGGQIDLV
ncbi:hypothetical protein MRB53_017902 [Persea americana]|uniref:Uncharacterized protein n=1 Tax=Persea americana TaxID=3435 RepID=A0ACC2M738_PERAE|nr:hypothetical protein MRB53_017902 [Persea americana]